MTDTKVLPTDPFDRSLAQLTGHPDGAQTQPSIVQSTDFYGNTTSFMVQTVRWEKGNSIFIEQVSAAGHARYMLPPEVSRVIARQSDAITTTLRRRQGRRLAEQFTGTRTFTPEQRAKALVTRKAKAAKRKARKTRRTP